MMPPSLLPGADVVVINPSSLLLVHILLVIHCRSTGVSQITGAMRGGCYSTPPARLPCVMGAPRAPSAEDKEEGERLEEGDKDRVEHEERGG